MIIDDEPLAVTLLESYVNKTPFLELKGAFNSAIEALPVISNNPPDLLFLDIQMPELSGMEFSRMLPSETRIIFTTAFEQYALDSYKVNALDYLLKPISYPDFLKSSQKALQWYEMLKKAKSSAQTSGDDVTSNILATGSLNSESFATVKNYTGIVSDASVTDSTLHTDSDTPDTIFIKADRKLIQVRLADILYVEGLKDYVKIHIEGQQYPILSLMTMKSMEELLPRNRFVRVHRSFIVHPEKIKIIERNRIVFGKERIPISDSYKAIFAEFISRRS